MDLVWAFLSGALIANTVPHFVHGISGKRFFTPWSRRSSDGLSSATENVLWATVNLGLGVWLFRIGQVGIVGARTNKILFMVGGLVLSLLLSWSFTKRREAVKSGKKK